MRYEIRGANESPFVVERDSLKIGDSVSSPSGDRMYLVDSIESSDHANVDAIAYVSFFGDHG